MTPTQLLLWRRDYRVSQQRLATLLGKSVRTVGNWERGDTRMPKGFEDTLRELVPHLATGTKREDVTADRVNSKTAGHLYVWRKGLCEPIDEHPETLFPGRWDVGQCPLAFLQGNEYAARVQTLRTALAAQQRGFARKAYEQALQDLADGVPHAPVCKCMRCNAISTYERHYLGRNNM